MKRIITNTAQKITPTPDRVKSTLVATVGHLVREGKSPDESLGELFRDVQLQRIYQDSKTFVDLVPRKRTREIMREYRIVKQDPDFDLKEFVSRHFYDVNDYSHSVLSGVAITARQHVQLLWPQLERRNRINRGSLFAVPNRYIVPGGRFQEQFYWDTYFVMLGLAADGRWSDIAAMMKNYAYMIRKFGFIPTANRTYYLSRSQPPFFSHMVRLYASHAGRTRTFIEYLPSMVLEHRFWMKGRTLIRANPKTVAYRRVVEMPNGTYLNRYFDNKVTPRPESMAEDAENATGSRDEARIFLDFRAAAESGWDFSSRWFRDQKDIQAIHTTDMITVDLNCLLYELEATIAQGYDQLVQPLLRNRYLKMAERRRQAILEYCWDNHLKFFCDYDFKKHKSTGRLTLAGVFPLYSRLATSEQAMCVAERIEKDFLAEGGLLTTLVDTGQQWDAPNGWAPLHWVAIQGLRNYGYHRLADTIRDRWLSTIDRIYAKEGKLVEKYNVLSHAILGTGGEYPLQDGFGWTNGVYAALYDEKHVQDDRE